MNEFNFYNPRLIPNVNERVKTHVALLSIPGANILAGTVKLSEYLTSGSAPV